MYKHLFGPVPSRRLGRSLGIDLVPYKTCSLDCIYCECGPTTHLTSHRKEYIPYQAVCEELDRFIKTSPLPDIFTFSGSGEPLLNNRTGDLIKAIKRMAPDIPVAVLTNGTLLSDPEVRHSILRADLVLPSLDAATAGVFKRLNRPHPALDIHAIIDGLAQFQQEYTGQIWLEVFIVPGLNDTKAELLAIKNAISEINPNRVQLNTLDRPVQDKNIRAATEKELEKIIEFWNLKIHTDIIARKHSASPVSPGQSGLESRILSILSRRPCTVLDLTEITGEHINAINKALRILHQHKKINSAHGKRGVFYLVTHDD